MKKKVLVTGGDGLVGSAIKEASKNYIEYGHKYEFIFINRDSGDLTNEKDVKYIFDYFKPNYVIHTAAKVGGIGGNQARHADFFRDNILMNTHLIHYCTNFNIQKLLAFSSVCVFPDNLATLQEDKMHDGPVFENNFAYGYAKRMVDVQIQAYKKQYEIKNYCSVIPGNIFGKNDMYCLKHGHVVPMLMHKLYLAKKNNTDFEIWGDGKSLREFLYVNDVANILVRLLGLDELPDRLIISGPQQYSIKELVELLVEISGFEGNVVWQTDKPNGQRSRPTDLTKLQSLFDVEFTPLKTGLKLSWDWLIKNYDIARKSYK